MGPLRSHFGAAVVAIPGDAGNIADDNRAVAETVTSFGQLDVFVGNAGVFDVYATLDDLAEDDRPLPTTNCSVST
jgi:2,3-dihydroxy-2,3-dihydrophenylpropionate dehydrogenase